MSPINGKTINAKAKKNHKDANISIFQTSPTLNLVKIPKRTDIPSTR
jgi:hypothetical protein